MGLQLVASRALAPFFGNSIFVWASLITTFLTAFSVGSFAGGALSSRALKAQSRMVIAVMTLGSGWLIFDALISYNVCDWLDTRINELPLKLMLACLFLYFVPVAVLSSLPPICIGYYDRRRLSAGRSAGLFNGVSTLGNIAGVLGTAFALIPRFGLHHLLHFWWVSSLIIQFLLWLVLYSRCWRSDSASQPLSAR